MKRRVQPVAPETLRRSYPITDQVPGWFFRVEETSPGAYRVEGADEYGRQVSCSGTGYEAVLERCADDALLMGAPVFVVTEHFDLTRMGLALAGDERMERLGGPGPWRAVVRTPDGTRVHATAYRPWFSYRVVPEFERISITLPDLRKADVPIGSEVFLRRLPPEHAD